MTQESDLRERLYPTKESRLLDALKRSGRAAALIGRQENFAWLTSGGSIQVSTASELGAAWLLVGPGLRIITARTMDGARILDEELSGLKYELVAHPWYDGSLARVLERVVGEVVSDIPVPGTRHEPSFFTGLHYPLLPEEKARYAELAALAERIIMETAAFAEPGMREKDIARFMRRRYADEDMDIPVLILGCDERIGLYRHCLPGPKRLERLLLLAPAPRKWGLCAPISRMVAFGGGVDPFLARSFEALRMIEAETLAMALPGARLADIFSRQQTLFAEAGYPEAWRDHFQGGMTGYIINDPSGCQDPEARVQEDQAFNWYITITGAKVEETSLVGAKGCQIISACSTWPSTLYTAAGRSFSLPDILLR